MKDENMNMITRTKLIKETEAMSLPDLIKMKRAELGMTQKELADASGISVSALKQYETGRQEPTIPKVRMIADVLGLSAEDIWSELSIGNVSDEKLRLTVANESVSFITEKATTSHLKQIREFISNLSGQSMGKPEVVEEVIELTSVEALSELIAEKGFKSRRVISAITAAREELAGLNIDELEEIAEENGVFLLEELSEGAEEQLSNRIICAVVYGEDLMSHDDKVINDIRISANKSFGKEIVSDNSGFLGMEGEAREYKNRLCIELPKLIVENAINRRFLPETILKTNG